MKKRQLRVTGNVQEKVNLAQPHSLPAHGLCAHICLRDSQCSWIMSHIRNSDMPINTGQYRQPTDNQTHDGPVMIHYATESQKFQWYCSIHHSSCSFVTHSPTHPPIHLPTHHPPTPIAISCYRLYAILGKQWKLNHIIKVDILGRKIWEWFLNVIYSSFWKTELLHENISRVHIELQ